jgi:hypothetical protein
LQRVLEPALVSAGCVGYLAEVLRKVLELYGL